MDDNIDSDEKCEYVALVKWIRSVPETEAKFRSGIYTTTHVRASLDNPRPSLILKRRSA
jgi:uncharacterized protein